MSEIERGCAVVLAVPDLEMTLQDRPEFRIDDIDGKRLWIGQDAPARD